MSTPAEWSPPRAPSAVARRYWAFVYLWRRMVWLALQVWAAAVCASQLGGPRWGFALAGLALGTAALWFYGRWLWSRYGRWVRRAAEWAGL